MVEDEPMFNSAQKLQARFDSDNDSFSVSLHSGYIRNQLNLRNGCTSIYISTIKLTEIKSILRTAVASCLGTLVHGS